MKSKYEEKGKLCYKVSDSFIVYRRTEGINTDLARHVETRFDTSNYELGRPFPKGKKLKSYRTNETWTTRKNKDKVCRIDTGKHIAISQKVIMKIIKEKGTKKCVIKLNMKLEDYKHCLEATQFKNKTNQLGKNKVAVNSLRENHKEFTENNRLMLKSEQKFLTIDLIVRYAFGTSKDLVCKKRRN